MAKPKVMVDPYFWMRDDERKSEKVLGHLRAENAHTKAATSALEEFKDSLYAELKSHVKETDITSAFPWGEWKYYTKTIEGLGYVIHARSPRSLPDYEGEEVVLDENEVAKNNTGSSFTSIGTYEPSPSQTMLAYTVDKKGFETYDIVVQPIGGAPVEEIKEVDSSLCWGKDDKHLYYLKFDEQHRPYQVWRHTVGGSTDDEMLYQEDDELFWVGIDKTLDGNYVLIETASTETSEVHSIDLNAEGGEAKAKVLAPRKFGTLYEADHRLGYWYMTTNDQNNKNFALKVARVEPSGAAPFESWAPLPMAVEGAPAVFGDATDTSPGATMVTGLQCFKDFLVVEGREDGYTKVKWPSTSTLTLALPLPLPLLTLTLSLTLILTSPTTLHLSLVLTLPNYHQGLGSRNGRW